MIYGQTLEELENYFENIGEKKFKAVQIYELIPLFIKVLKGEHLDSDRVIYFKTDNLHIECSENIVTDIDGEKGPDFPLDIKCIKGGLKILGVK